MLGGVWLAFVRGASSRGRLGQYCATQNTQLRHWMRWKKGYVPFGAVKLLEDCFAEDGTGRLTSLTALSNTIEDWCTVKRQKTLRVTAPVFALRQCFLRSGLVLILPLSHPASYCGLPRSGHFYVPSLAVFREVVFLKTKYR